ncbi:MAG: sulfatase-like hydrolase/transferase [Anaerolineales bacterium]|nr:MAG: sulfatase-like hydrolase/transferase [Anaerolineales bacterium]
MSQPNLLFLMTDGQRADTVGPGTLCQMPNLNQLATTGAHFDRCYAPNPICSPTRASLMTGLLPHSHGMVDCTHTVEPYRAKLKDGLPFWSQTLQAAGYHTGYFGKWHIERSQRLENFGFDTYEVESYHKLQGLVERDDQMRVRGMVQQKGYRDFLLYGVVDGPVEATLEHQLYSDGIRFLERAAQEPDRAWALFLSSEAPHDPWVVPRTYYERYNPSTIPRPRSFDDDLADRPGIYRRLQRVWHQLEWPQFAQATACYYALCSLLDDQIGRILAALQELGQAENTIVVFTSDHGDYMGAHRLMLKGVPAFEEAYRVPLILNGPGVPAGRRVEEIISLVDLAPTLIELSTGGDFPCHGRSLLPLLQPRVSEWRSEAFAEFHGQRFFYTQRVLWQDNYKYVFNGFDEDELYQLDVDPHEMHNLARDPAHRPVLEEMAGRMWEITRQTGDFNMYQAQYGMFRFAPVGPEWPVS